MPTIDKEHLKMIAAHAVRQDPARQKKCEESVVELRDWFCSMMTKNGLGPLETILVVSFFGDFIEKLVVDFADTHLDDETKALAQIVLSKKEP